MLSVSLTTNAAKVLQALGKYMPALGQGIAGALDRENELTIAHAQRTYLRGPRPERLGVVTSRLRRSLAKAPARVIGDRVISVIGTNVRYARIHEHGYTGPVQVAAHQRTATRTTTVSGGATFDPRTGRISRGRARKLTLRGATHAVRAHTRQVRMPARPYLAPSLQDRTAAYRDALSTVVVDTWEKS